MVHQRQNHLPTGAWSKGDVKDAMCHLLKHRSQTNIMVVPMDCPHNIHHKPRMGQFGHPHSEDDMAHNLHMFFSMFNHLIPPTIP
jgi:hypothetical protein